MLWATKPMFRCQFNKHINGKLSGKKRCARKHYKLQGTCKTDKLKATLEATWTSLSPQQYHKLPCHIVAYTCSNLPIKSPK